MMQQLVVAAFHYLAFFSTTLAAPHNSTDQAPNAHDPPLCVSSSLLFLQGPGRLRGWV